MSVTMPMIPDSTSFGYLASEGRGPPPPVVANLAPVNYHHRSMRDIIPLKAVPGSDSGPPEPVEPKLQRTVHRGPPAKLTPSSRTGSLYPSLALSLTEGDPKFKLAPLNYRSPSPVDSSASSRSNATLSRETSPVPSSSHHYHHHSGTVLPSIHSIASSRTPPPPAHRKSGSEDLTKKVAEINLEQQKQNSSEQMDPADHAKLIWQLFVAINLDYKKRNGTAPPAAVKTEEVDDDDDESMDLVGRESSIDVEMVAAR